MANLVAVNIKRKDAEVASHGFSIFLDPKRIKLQGAAEIPEIMEEVEALADANASAVPVIVQAQPTMLMPSPSPLQGLQPTQGQEASVLHESTVGTESGSKSSEPPLAAAAPMAMYIEEDSCQSQPPLQPQPGQHTRFFSGFF